MLVSEKIEKLKRIFNIKNNKKLAEKVNLPYTTVITISKGETEDIKLSTAKKFCDYFDLTLDELLDDNYSLPEYTIIDGVPKRNNKKGFFSDELISSINKIDLTQYDKDTQELILKIIDMNKKNK